MKSTSLLQVISMDLLVFSCILLVCVTSFDHSLFSNKSLYRRHKRVLFTDVTITNDLPIKTYFLDRYCIKHSDTEQRFRFDGQFGPIDVHGKLHVIVSSDALHSFTKRYRDQTYNRIPLYFLTVNYVIDQLTVSTILLLGLYNSLSDCLYNNSSSQEIKKIDIINPFSYFNIKTCIVCKHLDILY